VTRHCRTQAMSTTSCPCWRLWRITEKQPPMRSRQPLFRRTSSPDRFRSET
jgi:hypothetical protein